MTFFVYENISVNGIKDIMLIVGIVSAIVLRIEAKADKLIVNFLFCGQTSLGNKRLYQYSTDISVSVFSKAEHAIGTIREIVVVCLNTFEERRKIIIRISEIV